jgi:hypothetical protein
MKFSARVFVEKFHLNEHQAIHHVMCPFHPDHQPSLAIDLNRAQFFCHSTACSLPRGGGPLQFVLKWARYVDQKPITMSEARSQVRNAFRLTDARTFLREQTMKEVQHFIAYAAPRFADYGKRLDRAIADLDDYCADYPKQIDDEMWSMLTTLLVERQWADHAFAVLNRRRVKPNVFPILAECKRRGWWDMGVDVIEMEIAEQQRRARWLARQLEESCRPASPSPTKQPVPRRTPVR